MVAGGFSSRSAGHDPVLRAVNSPRGKRTASARSGLLALALILGATTARAAVRTEAPPPPENDRDRDRILHLQSALQNLVHNAFGRLKVGLRVIEAHTGRVFFGRGATALMDPASNQKVLATTTALVRLGNDWRFRTEVYGPTPDGNGVVHGDLYLRGNGDPTLATADLQELAAKVVARGVVRVDGAIVADPRRFGDDGPLPQGEEPSQLSVNRGTVAIRVRPGSPGEPPQVMLVPPPPRSPAGVPSDFMLANQARTTEGRGRKLGVQVNAARGVLQVDVGGRIGASSPGVIFRRVIPDRTLGAAILFRSELMAAGVAIRDRAAVGGQAAAATLLASHSSAPLGVLLRKINKESDNYEAERLLEAVGAEVIGGPATTEKGITVLKDVIGEFGLDPHTYLPKNGSGLGHANRLSAQAMTELLRALYLDPRVGPELLQSLSIGGVDGTTRNRFRGMLVARHVRAKTGTLNGKSCLSGLVGDGEDVMAFSIMVQGFRSRNGLAAVRGAQVAAVNTMMRYVQERGGSRTDSPAGDVAPAGTDYETGGDADTEDETPETPAAAPPPEKAPSPFETDRRIAAAVPRPRPRTVALAVSARAPEPAEVARETAKEIEPEPESADENSASVGLAGLGSLAGGDAVPGLGAFASYGRAESGIGVELAFYGTTFRKVSGPGTGTSEWTRYVGAIGPRYRVSGESLVLDVRALLAVGAYSVHGHNYTTDANSRTMSFGVGAGARLAWKRSRLAPWVGLDAMGWPVPQAIEVVGVADTRPIPALDLLLSIGASFRIF